MRPTGFSEHAVLTRIPSRIMLGFLLGTHLLALASLYLSSLDSWLCVFLSLAIVCHGYHATLQSWLLTGKDVVKEVVRKNDRWFLTLADGSRIRGELTGEVVVLEWFVALQFRHRDRKYPVILWSDSAHTDELRHLRVWLRLNATQALTG